MNKEKYIELLKTFIPSVEMQKYLADIKLNDKQISSIILGAPVSLDTKLKWTTGNEHNEIKQALDELSLNPNEVFYLIDNWYDEDIYDENSYGNAPFSSVEKVFEHIQEEIADCEGDYGDCNWYTLEKWALDKNGNYLCTYRYILIEDKIMFFVRRKFLKNGLTRCADYRFFQSTDLNLPVPFKVGDIVNIDCRPFAPVRQVKITDIGDNQDCCSLQTEYYDEKEKKYKTGDVINCSVFPNGYLPLLSPLYRISKEN